MFENLLNLVREHAGDAIINNSAVPNEKNDAAIETTTSAIMDSLKNQVSSGDLSSLAGMFKGNTANGSNGMIDMISGNVVKNLMSKLGVENAAAANIASSLIPMVMNKFIHKTNDPNDKSFDLQNIMSSLGGNSSLISSAMSMFGENSNNNSTETKDIFNSVKGLFGN